MVAYDTYDQAALADAPVHYWPLNSANAQVVANGVLDLVGVAHGTPTGSPTFNGTGVTLTTSGQYVTVPDQPTLSVTTTGQLTVEAWVSPSAIDQVNHTSGWVEWLGKGATLQREWALRYYNDSSATPRRFYGQVSDYSNTGVASAFWQAGFGNADTPPAANAWTHVVFTIDLKVVDSDNAVSDRYTYPGRVYLWINGVLKHAGDWLHADNTVPTDKTASMRIGTVDLSSYLAGRIRRVAVYDRRLATAEIAAHYDAETSTDVPKMAQHSPVGVSDWFASSGSVSAALPATPTTNNVMVAHFSYEGQTTDFGEPTWPSGWTVAFNHRNNPTAAHGGPQCAMLYRKVQAGDTGNITITWPQANRGGQLYIQEWFGLDTPASVVGSNGSWSDSATSGTVTAPAAGLALTNFAVQRQDAPGTFGNGFQPHLGSAHTYVYQASASRVVPAAGQMSSIFQFTDRANYAAGVVVFPLAVGISPPPMKPIVTATPSTNQVTLSWPADPNVDNFEVERDGVVVASPTDAFYVDTGIAATTYRYRVRGVRA